MKPIYFLFLLCTAFTAAQKERVQIKGIIYNENVTNLGGTTVFNTMSYEGTITDDGGAFSLNVKEGDVLDFKSVQFTNFKFTITAETVLSKKLRIKLQEGINELGEVRIADGSFMIPVVRIEDIDGGLNKVTERNVRVNAANRKENILSDRVRQPDEYTIRNEAFKQTQPRIDFFDFKSLIMDAINGKPLDGSDVSGPALNKDKEAFDVDILKNKFGTKYLVEFLKIKEDNLYEFMYFARDNGLNQSYFTADRELDLLEFLTQNALIFKKSQKN